ncbi:hypothetical protein AB0F17_35140 [Nonomuraea sp. NPDC026600]|uniref:hypothetical protein n=1 Tax=Nonomuraea sp. NPDC026600 TaxID=3155363 RepID=UPI0034007F02
MTTPNNSAPPLLSAAADLLECVGELPPLNVTQSVLAGVLITPASLAASEDDQEAVVQGIATGMRWPLRWLAGDDGWITSETVSNVRIEAIAAPLRRAGARDPLTRSTAVTAAEHAALLRALVDVPPGRPHSRHAKASHPRQ